MINVVYTMQEMENLSPEIILFDGIPKCDVKYVSYSSHKIDFLQNSTWTCASLIKVLPDFLSNRMVRRPYSPVSFIKINNIERYLDHADVIISQELYSFVSSQCAEVSKKAGKKLAISVWETIPSLPINYLPPYACNVRSVKENADIFIAHTDLAKKYLQSLSIPEEKIELIYPGVDLSMFKPARNKNHKTFRILYVGRFDKEKGLHYLLNAFSKLCDDKYDVELWIRAKKRGGELLSYSEELAKRYPIKFIDQVAYHELPNIYNQCDVFCLPSYDRKKWGIKIWEEQFGFVLMEAMACGLPIISTDCGAIPEVIGPANCVVNQQSEADLFNTLVQIINDDGLRNNTSKENRTRAERLFDIKKQKEKLGDVLNDLHG